MASDTDPAPNRARRADSAAVLCRPGEAGFLGIGSCDGQGRMRLERAAGPLLGALGSCWDRNDADGIVVLGTDPDEAPRFAARLRVDQRRRLCLGAALARRLPEGPLTLVRYQPTLHRVVLLDVGVAGTWIDRAVAGYGARKGWWAR